MLKLLIENDASTCTCTHLSPNDLHFPLITFSYVCTGPRFLRSLHVNEIAAGQYKTHVAAKAWTSASITYGRVAGQASNHVNAYRRVLVLECTPSPTQLP